jgi:hypothetical protein
LDTILSTDAIACDLAQAVRGVHVPYYLSGVANIIRLGERSKRALPSHHARELTNGLHRVREHFPDIFEHKCDRMDAEIGLHALIALVAFWANPAGRAAVAPHVQADTRDRARILQNLCHNESLRDDIRRRENDRMVEIAEQLMQTAVERADERLDA